MVPPCLEHFSKSQRTFLVLRSQIDSQWFRFIGLASSQQIPRLSSIMKDWMGATMSNDHHSTQFKNFPWLDLQQGVFHWLVSFTNEQILKFSWILIKWMGKKIFVSNWIRWDNKSHFNGRELRRAHIWFLKSRWIDCVAWNLLKLVKQIDKADFDIWSTDGLSGIFWESKINGDKRSWFAGI